MPKTTRTFSAGRMNKAFDERLIPDGEFIDALNMRFNSSENDGMYIGESTRGNELVATPQPLGLDLSNDARCIGAFSDNLTGKIYVFVTDQSAETATGVLDCIYSYDPETYEVNYNLISVNNGSSVTTTGFDPLKLIYAVNVIGNEMYFSFYDEEPMVIDLNKSYTVISGVDSFTKDDILVIKKPPLSAPSVSLSNTGGDDDFLNDRFLCFAYRYRYENNKYSATSAFSKPAFEPGPFNLSFDDFLNDGMSNRYNAATVTLNTGGPAVVGVEVLIKDSMDSTIKIVDKINKSTRGYSDNQDISITYSSEKITGLIPETELLRLWDDVPYSVGAQTSMGNRIMYGDYVIGNDMVGESGNPFTPIFTTSLISEEPSMVSLTTDSNDNEQSFSSSVVPNSLISIDFSGASLTKGSFLNVFVRVSHQGYYGDTPYPTETTDSFDVSTGVLLSKDYNSAHELAQSEEFKKAFGVYPYRKEIADACDAAANSMYDAINCQMPDSLGGLVKFGAGVDSADSGAEVISSTSSEIIQIAIQSVRYVDDATTPSVSVFAGIGASIITASIQNTTNVQSLHSGWGYETGIVYMDDKGRSSDVITSLSNTVKVPNSGSYKRNSIRVYIPKDMEPPAWASHYRFVVRPTHETYETVFSQIYFQEDGSNNTWVLLEGENTAKVDEGDTIIVKTDVDGPTQNGLKVRVLSKESKATGDVGDESPAGLYIKISANGFRTDRGARDQVVWGEYKDTGEAFLSRDSSSYPGVAYPLFYKDTNISGGVYENVTIPQGTRIRIKVDFERNGISGSCGKKIERYDKTFISGADYDDLEDWFTSEGISFDDFSSDLGGGETESTVELASSISSTINPSGDADLPESAGTHRFAFWQNTAATGQPKWLIVKSGTPACTDALLRRDGDSSVRIRIDINRAGNVLCFETEPSESLPNVYYENGQVFNISSQSHECNTQNQVFGTTPGIVDLDFFNCYSFGNGVESIKIRDSVGAKSFSMGERVRSSQLLDYRRRRLKNFVTWGGVFNDEANLNRVAQFNQGLNNWKELELSFGPIMVLDGRKTDLLVLQEDRVSYVLSGKNLLSDAIGGGTISSVPEVLGTQIARIEEYGCSNKESYDSYGYEKIWVDAKRGAVLRISGGSGSSEKMEVISDVFMRPYFRDLMTESIGKQILGSFDSFTGDFILSTNDTQIPSIIPEYNCGLSKKMYIASGTSQVFDVKLGPSVGDFPVEWISGPTSGTFKVDVLYNGVTTSSGNVSTSGSATITKNSVVSDSARITVSSSGGDSVITLNVGCVDADTNEVQVVVITSKTDIGKSIHIGYNYTNGSYNSPAIAELVTFVDSDESLIRSLNVERSGNQGTSGIPIDGGSVNVFVSERAGDSLEFNSATHRILYQQTSADLTLEDMISGSSTQITPSQNTAGDWVAIIPSINSAAGKLYIIFDLRNNNSVSLCKSVISAQDACCNC